MNLLNIAVKTDIMEFKDWSTEMQFTYFKHLPFCWLILLNTEKSNQDRAQPSPRFHPFSLPVSLTHSLGSAISQYYFDFSRMSRIK